MYFFNTCLVLLGLGTTLVELGLSILKESPRQAGDWISGLGATDWPAAAL